jgi:hypothetical protein
MKLRAALLVLLACLPLVACTSPDPKQELALSEVEGYWVVDTPEGGMQRISPALRFRLTNKAATRPIQANATFKRAGAEQVEWGSGFEQVAAAGKPIPIGESKVVVLIADSRYRAPGEPEEMFKNPEFKDAKVDLFLRLGSSQWVKMATVDVERRLGTRKLEAAPATP